MPRYVYRCDKCEKTFQVVHSIKEKLTDCEECDSKDTLKRVPSIPLVLNNKQDNDKRQVGSFVKEYIENAKEDLKQEKEELLNQEHKDG
tara:strand:+ start:507 stop:773 length:267 start_codon:yes stop_codon:yes gene_type:complete